jgi:Protein of unknown function (DUF1592)/Protein of unknown function (DUF1588)/Protein of unknown function (DUF1595)/Protein of unknown function (DUF1585)
MRANQTANVSIVAGLGLLFAACTGSSTGSSGSGGSGNRRGGGTGGSGEVPPGPIFTCDENEISDSIGLRKLTTAQYTNAVTDVLRFALKGDSAAAMGVMTAISASFDLYPEDSRYLNGAVPTNRQMNQAVQSGHVEESFGIAMAIGKELSTKHLQKIAGACATDSDTANDDKCITDFINGFGARALRRPLDADDVKHHRTFYGADSKMDPLAWADLIGGFLTAPQFLYMVEHGVDEVAGIKNVFELSAYELASRLSFHFLHSMPDEELWQAAVSDDLLKEDGYSRQVDRLMALAEAQRSTKEFFEDVLRVQDFDDVAKNKGDAQFKLFAADHQPSDMLKTSIVEDTVGMAQYYTWEGAGSMTDLLSSERSFARSKELADIYGTPVWDGKGEPPAFPAEQERVGIFTRAGFLATGLVTTRPIIKGAHLRQSWLCDEIPPPDPGAANTPQDTVNRSTREAVELITEQDGTTCKSCHLAFTNHIGFATESFDGLGRYRTEEMVFGADKKPSGMVLVNTKATPQIIADDMTEVSGPAELMKLVRDSGKVEACFAKHYFRYTFARLEDETRDGCALEQLRVSVASKGAKLQGMFKEATFMPEFKTRLIEP